MAPNPQAKEDVLTVRMPWSGVRVKEANHEGSTRQGKTGSHEGALGDRRLEKPGHTHAH